MFSISRTAHYAIRVMVLLADPSAPTRSSIPVLSQASGIPQAYLAKIIRRLAEARFIEARKGRKGGIWLACDPARVSLWDIGSTIDGEGILSGCLLGEALCRGEENCPLHAFWGEQRQAIRDQLGGFMLSDAARFVDAEIRPGEKAARAV